MTDSHKHLPAASSAGVRRLVHPAAARWSAVALLLSIPGSGNGLSSGRDIVLVLDLPASAYGHQVTATAISDFDRSMDATSRIGVVSAAGERAEGITPLGAPESLSLALPKLKAAAESVERKDPASGVERALYELRIAGRPNAEQAVILVSDGRVEMGDGAGNAEHVRWLAEALREDAARRGIKVHAIAWSAGADIPLLQSLTAATGGKYFRAIGPDELPEAFRRIAAALQASAVVGDAAAVMTGAPSDARRSSGFPDAAWITDKSAFWWIGGVLGLAALSIIMITVLGGRRRARRKGDAQTPEEPTALAFLADLRGMTHISRYVLGPKPVVLGRTAGHDRDATDYIVIGLPTIGRRHALIEYRDKTFWIADLGSVNGTYVNGVRMRDRQRLHHGDRIRMHHCEFRIEIPGAELDGDPTARATTTKTTIVGTNTAVAAISREGVTIDLGQRAETIAAGGRVEKTPSVPAGNVAAAPGAPAGLSQASGGAAMERDTVVLQKTKPTPPSSGPSGTTWLATTPVAAPHRGNGPERGDKNPSLEGFISTKLLKTQPTVRRSEADETQLPGIAPAATAAKPAPPSPYSVDEVSIEDFLNEAQGTAGSELMNTWELPGQGARSAAAVTTEPLEDQLSDDARDEDSHMGDTQILGEATLPPNDEK